MKFNNSHKITPRIKKKYFHLRQEASLNRMLNGDCNYGLSEVFDKALTKLEKKFPTLNEAYILARGF